jgi:heme exporter protein D
MKEKSKFVSFLLSFVPGLSHLYLGFSDRGAIFLIVFFALTFGVAGLCILAHTEKFIVILAFALPILWLVALIDASSMRKKAIFNECNNTEREISDEEREEAKKSNRKTIAMTLSIIPGAGHMYLGYQKKGLVIMGAFFFTIFFMGWLNLSLFLFVLPLIWFYSFFDALHSVDGNNFESEEVSFIFPKIKPEWIGWGLIVIGILVVVERVLYPLLSYAIRNYIQTAIVSAIFIAGGIRLLKKNKNKEDKKDKEVIDESDKDGEDI